MREIRGSAFVSLDGIVQVAVGRTFALALASDGAVWSWGSNYSGQLGNETTTNRSIPQPVPGFSGFMVPEPP